MFIMCFMWLVLVPGVVLMGQCFRRTPMMGRELLMPVERAAYLRQMGLAAALSHVKVWAAVGAVLTLWWVIAAGHPFHFAAFTFALLVSAAWQFFVFGVAVWSARRRSLAPIVMTLMFGGQVPLTVFFESPMGDGLSVALAATVLLGILGLLLTWAAYRRWLVADFD
jgi:hypothetical protein